MSRAHQEFVDFIASGSTPSGVVDFAPSQETKDRVADLLHREKTSELTPEERSELAHYMEIEHIMRLAKARARELVASE